jgi:hypothetical protein
MDLKNPWTEIPDRPDFVLPQDEPFIRSYNRLCEDGAPSKINLAHTPEPRLGPLSAPVYMLLANPSYNASQPDGEPDPKAREAQLESARRDDTTHLGIGQPNDWWRKRVRRVADAVGTDKAARGICSVEFFPYRSLKFDHAQIRLPSQQYTFGIVRDALRDGRLIIVMRVASAWFGAIPELADSIGKTVFIAKNNQSSYLTDGNLGDVAYGRLCEQLTARS